MSRGCMVAHVRTRVANAPVFSNFTNSYTIFPIVLSYNSDKYLLMTRRSRRHNAVEDDDAFEEESLASPPPSVRRSRRHVSTINESDGIEDSGAEKEDHADSDVAGVEVEGPEDEYEDAASGSESEEVMPKKRRRLTRSLGRAGEDSDFKEEVSSNTGDEDPLSDESDDGYLSRLRNRQDEHFVATDDEDDSYKTSSNRRRLSRKSGSRVRSSETRRRTNGKSAKNEEDDAHDDSLHQELQDLYDSSPEASPMKHKLREREKKIDYTLPSLITNDTELYRQQGPPLLFRSRGRKPVGSNSDVRHLLFPTAGPFGGSDVISIFGENVPPGGIPIPGMTHVPSSNNSDSSDDEFQFNTESAPTENVSNMAALAGQNPGAVSGIAANGSVVNNTNIRGAEAVGKKKNSLSDTDPLGVDMNIDFKSVGGLDNYIDQLKEMVALPLLYPELYQNFSITPPRGVLFHGPPGTGKTLMARALAASCSTPSRKITFFMRKGADCLSKWVGEAERQLRLLFEEAKNQQPSIIFFDEIDGLAPVRSSKQEQIHASIVSTLLALMDGMDNRGQVIVIGATNRPDSVDPALRRPGRFDREFYFPLPDIDARKQILKIHTGSWNPPLSDSFIDNIAGLTKGYGGADLRALCTEAALNSIQRKYPQIYESNEKLQVRPSKVRVVAKDFMCALDKIVPSSARSTSSGSAPIPDRLQPLLMKSLEHISQRLNHLLPGSIRKFEKKKPTVLEEARYFDPTVKDEDGGFAKHELLKNLQNSRTCKPRLLVCGERGAGQQYLGSAVLNLLEGFLVQNLDLATMFGDVTRTPELCIVQTFIEAKRHQPSIIFIPNIDTWFEVMPYSARATLSGMLRNLRSDERVLLLGIAELPYDTLDTELKKLFGFSDMSNNVALQNPNSEARLLFFSTVEKALTMKPFEFINDLENRPRRKLKPLKVIASDSVLDASLSKKRLKQQEYEDTKLKNILKLKLAGIMDLFKIRYKRFKKPLIDHVYIQHLFDPSILENPNIPYEVLYVKSDEPSHTNMLKELATGKYFYNMDLDTVEERIWNGFYSEAKQFTKDIRMIVKDAVMSGDRDRILKANEMLTNAQFGIEDFNNAQFAKACKEMRDREVIKQEKLLQDHKHLQAEFAKKQKELLAQESTQGLEGLNGQAPVGDMAILNDDTNETGEPSEDVLTDKLNGVYKPSFASLGEDPKESVGSPTNSERKAEEKDAECQEHAAEISQDTEANNKEDVDVSMTNGSGAVSAGVLSSESEAEEGFSIDFEREIIIPSSSVQQLFAKDIVAATSGFTVEQLESFAAKLMDIVWEDRAKWDKSETVRRLEKATEDLAMHTNIV